MFLEGVVAEQAGNTDAGKDVRHVWHVEKGPTLGSLSGAGCLSWGAMSVSNKSCFQRASSASMWSWGAKAGSRPLAEDEDMAEREPCRRFTGVFVETSFAIYTHDDGNDYVINMDKRGCDFASSVINEIMASIHHRDRGHKVV